MNTTLPFGFPFATSLYLTLYGLTLAVHVVLMNYVLAGTLYLGVAGLRRGRGSWHTGNPIADRLRDWMPFALGAAITAGVAPLLFVQVLYKTEFYTANLLLLHRFMAILPLLIIGFYLLYVLKSKWARMRPVVRGAAGVIAGACFVYIAWSWTANHLLSLRPQADWNAMHAGAGALGARGAYVASDIVPRLFVWGVGAAPTMALVALWQVRSLERDPDPSGRPVPVDRARAVRQLALIAMVGLVLAGAGCGWYSASSGQPVREALVGPMGRVWFGLAGVGFVIQGGCWLRVWMAAWGERGVMLLASVGLVLTVLGMTGVREAIRLGSLGVERVGVLTEEHRRLFENAGGASLVVFLVFALLCAGGIVWCVRTVLRAGSAPGSGGSGSPA